MWVLIIIFSASYGKAITTADFNTEAACRFAVTETVQADKDIKAMCVPKGEK